jgi:gas vesicle protein
MKDLNAVGYFFGLGVGTAAGLLFAPKTGVETRGYLNAKARTAADVLKQQGRELHDRAAEGLERGTRRVRDQVSNLSDAVDAGKQAFQDAVDETSQA